MLAVAGGGRAGPRDAPGPAPPPVGAVRAAPGERAGGGIRSQAVWCACVTVPHGADETLPEVQDFGERFHNAEEM